MNNTGRTIAKNASFLMVSQIVTWVFTILLTIFLPRYLGPSGVGQFHLANSLWAIVVVVATFGMDILLTKEIARRPEQASELFGTSLFLRLVLYLLGSVAMMIYVVLAGYEQETVIVIAVVGIGDVFVLLLGAVESSLKGLERMGFISLGSIISKAILTVTTIAVLVWGGGAVLVAAVGIPAVVINLLIQFHYLQRVQKVSLRPDLSKSREMLKASAPYLVVYIFLVLYMQVDIVIISLLVDEVGVGWYGAADQLFGTLLFIPTVIMTAVFPALSRLHMTGSDSASRLMSRSFDLMLMIAVPVGMGVMVVANNFVVLLFGPAFAPSGPILAIMGLVLILTYQNMLLGQFLISIDRQNVWTRVMAVATVATIPLDLVFVNWFQSQFGNGAIGGALSFLVTETGMMLVGLRYLPPGTLSRHDAWLALRIVAAGLIMVASIWWLRDAFIALPIALGMVVYVLAILVLGVVSNEERHLLATTAHGLTDRLRQRLAPIVN